MDTSNKPSDTRTEEENNRKGVWAKPVDRLKVSGIPDQALNWNVEGRTLTGPLQGFGQLWQKTYRVRLSGADVTPAEVIKTWRENFGSFWPKGNHFYTPLTRIEPGEVAVLNLAGPGGMPLSTGVIVIYADEESFSFMNPAGHMFAGMITFSSDIQDGATCAQVQVLVRANDPLWEIVMRMFGFRKEDQFWQDTLKSLARYYGVNAEVKQQTTCVDPRLQWSQFGNVWHNAGIRSGIYMVSLPFRWVGRLIKRPDRA